MESVRARLSDATDRTLARLGAMGLRPWTVPKAGMFVWARLPEGLDAADVARACLREDVVMAPGNAFSQSLSAQAFLRFNVAQCEDKRVFEVLARALGR